MSTYQKRRDRKVSVRSLDNPRFPEQFSLASFDFTNKKLKQNILSIEGSLIYEA